tara:strand:+ start:262 stop:480 length:219 start_codon:yes stop_codon:yes gene_type:complete
MIAWSIDLIEQTSNIQLKVWKGDRMIVYKGKAKNFPEYIKSIRKIYAIKTGKLITKQTKLSEVLECITQKKN